MRNIWFITKEGVPQHGTFSHSPEGAMRWFKADFEIIPTSSAREEWDFIDDDGARMVLVKEIIT